MDKKKLNKHISFKSIVDCFKSQDMTEQPHDIYSDAEKAKQEWQTAQSIFENVDNPDLIDYAIYNMEAAEKRYTYLIKQIKQENI